MASAGPVFPIPPSPHAADIPRTPYPLVDGDLTRKPGRSTHRTARESTPPALGGYPAWQFTQQTRPGSASVTDSPPTSPNRISLYNRPRRLSDSSKSSSSSSSSTATIATTVNTTGITHSSSYEAFDGSPKSPPWSSSQTSFETIISNMQNPVHASPHQHGQQLPRQRPPANKARKATPTPGDLFAALPSEVLVLILEELKALHLQPGSDSCATCWMRDCCSVALSARKWLKFARAALYEDIQLVGPDGAHMRKRYKLSYGARLALLRRTLRSLPHVAVVVRSLKVPALPHGVDTDQYCDLVASVVMACPNIERLVGFHPHYNHTFSRLFHALSSRQKLKAMDWILGAAPAPRPSSRSRPQGAALAGSAPLNPEQADAFLENHANWLHLTSLTVHSRPGAAVLPDRLLMNALRCLPQLQNLYLSDLPPATFNDASLLSLPPLRKLTLSRLQGVTTAGLSSFATRPNNASISALSLLHLELDSLPALARIFSNLSSLDSFAIVQHHSPTMPPDEQIWLFPYLASPTLRFLHWDMVLSPDTPSPSDTILARSITAAGFPALRTLRAPSDTDGLFQALCRPRERVALPADRYATGDDAAATTASAATDLRRARLRAQARLETARSAPRFFVNVTDEEGLVVEKHGLGGFTGSVTSKVEYVLTPDPGATDATGGLVGMAEMLGDGGEDLGLVDGKKREGRVEGCTGRWNAGLGGAGTDKKDRERWWHVERGRWKGVTLS